MPRLLDIVVPHYNEPWEVLRPFFDILNAQKCVDFQKFKVWFIQDGPAIDLFPSGYFQGSPLQMEVVTIPHKGVSAARNKGIDLADSEWICFCDCDDSYTSIYSLMKILYILSSPKLKDTDRVWGKFYASGYPFPSSISICGEFESVFIHNKYYRLSFLREHNIRFCEDLYMSEDSAFNTIVNMEIKDHRTQEIIYPEPLYAWCRRPGSITMDFSRWLSNTEGHFNRNLYILDEWKKRNAKDLGPIVARTITDIYSMLTKSSVPEASKAFLERVRQFYLENLEIFNNVSPEKLRQALEASDKDAGINDDDRAHRLSFKAWLAVVAGDIE